MSMSMLNFEIANKYFWWTSVILSFVYATWYSLLGYDNLVLWYMNSHPHFYKDDVWSKDFFTSGTYSFGVWYSWLLVCLLLFITIARRYYKENIVTSPFHFQKAFTQVGIGIFFLSATILWLWQSKADYATDEIFSAVHFAEKPLFLTISHYPLPNNHIFFNVLNHFMGWASVDLVITGRLISVVSVALTMVFIYGFMSEYIKGTFANLCIILLLLSVFPLFGFGTQARGYGIHIFLSWIAFSSLFTYLKHKANGSLQMYTISVVLGLWTMPSFLYYWVGISLTLLIFMLKEHRLDKAVVYSTFKILVLTALLYMPAITFSGVKAIFGNKYVSASKATYGEFLSNLFSDNYFQGLFNEWFGTGQQVWLAIIILLIPFGFYLVTKQKIILHWCIYIFCFGFTLLLMIILMKKFPFYRNLVSHGLMFWVFFLLISGYFVENVKPKLKPIWMGTILSISVYFTFLNTQRYPFHLYYYDVNAWNQPIKEADLTDLAQKRVFIHDESFFWDPAVKKVTSTITHGATVLTHADYIIIDSIRSKAIKLQEWEMHNQVGETIFWKRKIQ